MSTSFWAGESLYYSNQPSIERVYGARYPLHAKFKNGDKHEFAAIYHKHDIPKEEPKEELPAASSMSLLQVDRHD